MKNWAFRKFYIAKTRVRIYIGRSFKIDSKRSIIPLWAQPIIFFTASPKLAC